MNKKQAYSAPEAETFVVQTEGAICWSAVNPVSLILFSEWGDSGASGAEMIEDRGYDL